jgi:hypothetical protein
MINKKGVEFCTFGPIYSTRFPLSYQRQGKIWRILSEDGKAIGPQYKSRFELLVDLERYAKEYGY